ncbi:MAG TPA: hypothetical protein VJ986_06010, partial [Gaiellaceae bacterium]|nr:hypothetical protein [Gaiellaceae bacterium]
MLQVGGSTGIQFWGVAAIQTNFDFLQQYGIYLSGSALLQINMTGSAHQETLTLAGIPGGTIFTAGGSSYTSLLASLPADTFNPVDLSQSWTTLFANPGSDSNVVSTAAAPLTLKLNSGQTLTFEKFAGTTLQNAQVEGVVAGKEWKILNGDGRQFFIKTQTDANGNPILVVAGEQRTYNLPALSFELEVVGGLTIYAPHHAPKDPGTPQEWVHADGGFLLQITSTQTTFFMTAGGSVVPLDISGRMTGLLVLNYSDTNPGLAGMFKVELGVGVPSTDTSSSGVSNISGIFTFSGSVMVNLNSTLSAVVFTVPQEFLSVLPAGFPGTLTICGHTPEIDGTCTAGGTPAVYIQAIVTGEITLGNVLTLTGTIGFEAAVGANSTSFIRIFGAVSTNIKYLGSLSGSLDLGFYTASPTDPAGTFDPGIIGRVSLALDSSAIPGVSLSGHFVLEVNLFLNSSANVQTVTFVTNLEECKIQHPTDSSTACASVPDPNQLAVDPTSHLIETGLVTIDQGLRLELQGTLTIASIVDVNGSFVFSFSKDPFAIEIVAHASIALHGLGTMGAGGSLTGIFLLDGNGLSLYMSIGADAMGNFGSGVGLGFSASATLSFSTVAYTRNIDDTTGKTCTAGAANCVSIQS